MLRKKVLARIRDLVQDNKTDRATAFQQVAELLNKNFPSYAWVGIYLVEGEELVLAAWKGPAATEHIRIPIGQGVCGSAAASGITQVVNDVSQNNRYLSCFADTKSEIVVPISKDGRIIGEIDIDSNKLSAFNNIDQEFLEDVATVLAEL